MCALFTVGEAFPLQKINDFFQNFALTNIKMKKECNFMRLNIIIKMLRVFRHTKIKFKNF